MRYSRLLGTMVMAFAVTVIAGCHVGIANPNASEVASWDIQSCLFPTNFVCGKARTHVFLSDGTFGYPQPPENEGEEWTILIGGTWEEDGEGNVSLVIMLPAGLGSGFAEFELEDGLTIDTATTMSGIQSVNILRARQDLLAVGVRI